MAALRVVGETPPTEPPAPSPIATEIHAAAEQAIADGALIFCMVYETAHEAQIVSCPSTDAVDLGTTVILRAEMQEKYGQLV